jgi:hypothetical protein
MIFCSKAEAVKHAQTKRMEQFGPQGSSHI